MGWGGICSIMEKRGRKLAVTCAMLSSQLTELATQRDALPQLSLLTADTAAASTAAAPHILSVTLDSSAQLNWARLGSGCVWGSPWLGYPSAERRYPWLWRLRRAVELEASSADQDHSKVTFKFKRRWKHPLGVAALSVTEQPRRSHLRHNLFH